MLTKAEYDSILRLDFGTFIERAFYELNPETPYFRSPHIEVIATALEACRRGEIRRLIINVPPRHLKSHCSSIAFVAWYLAHNPAGRVICASYGQDLADKLARDTRSIMQALWYRQSFWTRISETRQAVDDFETTESGCRMATSVGGVLTGRGADLILIDDPLKPDEALSETRRKAVNDWYDNTLLSRLNNKETGCIIIVMQRLHQDDLVGHVLGQGDWKVLSFPAIAEEEETHVIETPFGRRLFKRAIGDVLHPERESRNTLETIRKSIGEYNFSSQYQQNPMPRGGNLIKTAWLKYFDPSETIQGYPLYLQSWDTANKASEFNDYSVCTTWYKQNSNYYLVDVFRERLEYPELLKAVQTQAKKCPNPTIIIEDKASGIQLIQDLKRLGVLWVSDYKPLGNIDKEMRLYAQTRHFESGNVYLPLSAPWLQTYIKELTSFPGSKFDDQVDSTTQALDYMTNHWDLELWTRL